MLLAKLFDEIVDGFLAHTRSFKTVYSGTVIPLNPVPAKGSYRKFPNLLPGKQSAYTISGS